MTRFFTRGAVQVRAGRCGERTERRRWRMKRSERVAAVKISSVRRKAAQKFWAPQQDHRPLRKRNKGCNGRATARVAPTEGCKGCSKAGGVEPRPYGQLGGWYGGPMWASAPTEALQGVQQSGPSGTPAPTNGTGDADCHDQFANWSRNDTLQGMRCKIGGRTEASAPTEGYKGCSGYRTGGVEPRPYGGQ